MENKGYILTVSAFFLMSLIVILAIFFSARVEKMDIAGQKLAALYDDVRGDIFDLLDLSVTVGDFHLKDGDLKLVKFEEDLGVSGVEKALEEYENYVEKSYTSEVNEYLEDRYGSNAGADISMNLGNKTLIMVPYNYVYEYNNFSKMGITIYPMAKNTNLLGFVINLTVPASIENLSNMQSSISKGDIAARIILNWRNSTYENTTYISADGVSSWVFKMQDGTINITSGLVRANQGEAGQINSSASISLRLEGEARAHSAMTLIFERLPHFSLESGFTIMLKDIRGYRRMLNKTVDYTRITDNIWFDVGKTLINSLPLDVKIKPPSGERELWGFCVCEPCHYWEAYFGGETPCEERPCPARCQLNETMVTWWI